MTSIGLQPGQVVHISDSLSSDVKGASDLGIHAIWVNRSNWEVPEGVASVADLLAVKISRE
ncbi:MAG: HAD family hydrolase [Lachnospiraceae bacterium]|nr:HAD family hydrolase [Lachnospiraceae bacterium]